MPSRGNRPDDQGPISQRRCRHLPQGQPAATFHPVCHLSSSFRWLRATRRTPGSREEEIRLRQRRWDTGVGELVGSMWSTPCRGSRQPSDRLEFSGLNRRLLGPGWPAGGHCTGSFGILKGRLLRSNPSLIEIQHTSEHLARRAVSRSGSVTEFAKVPAVHGHPPVSADPDRFRF